MTEGAKLIGSDNGDPNKTNHTQRRCAQLDFKIMNRNKFRMLALGGIIGPLLFTLVVITSAAFRPNYNHLHDFMSALGASDSPTEHLMNFVGFLPTGLLMALFGLSLFIYLRSSKSFLSIIGSLLIVIFGLGMITAGIYSCDADCFESVTKEGVIHGQVSSITFPSVILGILLLGISFGNQVAFRKFMWYTLLTALLAGIFMVNMIGTFETRTFTGLWQRLLLLSVFTWTAVIGLFIYNSGKALN